MPLSVNDPGIIIGLLVGVIVGLIIPFLLIRSGIISILHKRYSVMFFGRSYLSSPVTLFTLTGYRAILFGTFSIIGGLTSLLVLALCIVIILSNAPEPPTTTLIGSFVLGANFVGLVITVFGLVLASFFELLFSIRRNSTKEKTKYGESNDDKRKSVGD